MFFKSIYFFIIILMALQIFGNVKVTAKIEVNVTIKNGWEKKLFPMDFNEDLFEKQVPLKKRRPKRQKRKFKKKYKKLDIKIESKKDLNIEVAPLVPPKEIEPDKKTEQKTLNKHIPQIEKKPENKEVPDIEIKKKKREEKEKRIERSKKIEQDRRKRRIRNRKLTL